MSTNNLDDVNTDIERGYSAQCRVQKLGRTRKQKFVKGIFYDDLPFHGTEESRLNELDCIIEFGGSEGKLGGLQLPHEVQD